MPKGNGLYLLQMQLTDQAGKVLHRNFVTFVVKDGDPVQDTGLQCVSFAPASFSARDWSVKQWNVLDGLKVNGTGSGYFEYTIPWPAGLKKRISRPLRWCLKPLPNSSSAKIWKA